MKTYKMKTTHTVGGIKLPFGMSVYAFEFCDYGVASADSRYFDREHISVTMDRDGYGPSYSVPLVVLTYFGEIDRVAKVPVRPGAVPPVLADCVGDQIAYKLTPAEKLLGPATGAPQPAPATAPAPTPVLDAPPIGIPPAAPPAPAPAPIPTPGFTCFSPFHRDFDVAFTLNDDVGALQRYQTVYIRQEDADKAYESDPILCSTSKSGNGPIYWITLSHLLRQPPQAPAPGALPPPVQPMAPQAHVSGSDQPLHVQVLGRGERVAPEDTVVMPDYKGHASLAEMIAGHINNFEQALRARASIARTCNDEDDATWWEHEAQAAVDIAKAVKAEIEGPDPQWQKFNAAQMEASNRALRATNEQYIAMGNDMLKLLNKNGFDSN